MLARLTSHLGRNLVAYLALFVALGGTAYGAAKFTGADVIDETLTGADVQNNTLTGDDILESSLGKVGDADTLDGLSSGFFQDASNLTSGTLADARLSANVATDSEIFPTVLNNDGSGSQLDADTLDGKNSSEFLAAGAKAADSDKLDGKDSTDFLSRDLIARSRDTALDAGSTGNTFVNCNAGEFALGGGVALLGSGGGLTFGGVIDVSYSIPSTVVSSAGVPEPRGWQAAMSNASSQNLTMRVTVICAAP